MSDLRDRRREERFFLGLIIVGLLNLLLLRELTLLLVGSTLVIEFVVAVGLARTYGVEAVDEAMDRAVSAWRNLRRKPSGQMPEERPDP